MGAAMVDQKNMTEVGDPERAPATVVADVNAKDVAAVSGEMCRVELHIMRVAHVQNFSGRRPALLL